MSRKRHIDEINDTSTAIQPSKRRKLNSNNSNNESNIPPSLSPNTELIPCEHCNNMIPFNEYLSHLQTHQTSNTNPNNNNNNNPIMIPCEFANCTQKLILAEEYNDHIQSHQLQATSQLLFNINSNSNNNKNNTNNITNPFEFKQENISYNKPFEDIAFYLTKSPFINNKQFTLSLSDIINSSSNSNSIISKCIFFNYMFDINWLFNVCPILKNKTKVENIYLFHGSQIDQTHLNQSNIIIKKIKIKYNIQWGTHHTKMILICYKNEGIRIVITTANIIQTDWFCKTNGIYLQDFPLKDTIQNNNKKNERGFEQVLKKYLDDLVAINDNKQPMNFAFINGYDFSSAKCLLIPSIPGYHKWKYINYYGHMRVRDLLNKYNITNNNSNDCLISCVSSMGSLNEKYITNELCNNSMKSNENFKLIWPNVNDIKNSIEGYSAGGSVCFSNKNYLKMQWLNKYFYKWNGKISNRMKLIPHIKCYCNVNTKDKILNYFILTSANLSKAAWGSLQKNNTQLGIRSYEMGCLFIREYYINNYLKHKHKGFCLNDLPNMKRNLLKGNYETKEKKKNGFDNCEFEMVYEMNKNDKNKNNKNIVFPIPMEVFDAKKYSMNDKPWVWDLQYNEKDSHGLTWPPNSFS